ncbi:response regulator [Candidatus Magnetomonas plexicatena]|uniref:response regulator n=1 Tax=Candidatus Magnetomonas plexicatena TaxID=2552947 RepID=UPI0011007621|nr:response regulator [Nitrospirales bacterium LBB_01]
MGVAIVVVDDSRSARRVLCREIQELFTEKNITIDEAVNGIEALQFARSGKYDLMFLDLTMPVMDGYEVLKAIKSEGLSIKVIVLSADIQPKAQQLVKELGALEFLCKPLDCDTVLEVLREHNFI